ncbi:Uncharacterized protein Fot_28993 [Forsythia ovata]|uniref:Uncharacterized protein n=1 Tax=Forsythia ovata TaxID=205694 RepID=A0ABD1TQL2_9LAMI
MGKKNRGSSVLERKGHTKFIIADKVLSLALSSNLAVKSTQGLSGPSTQGEIEEPFTEVTRKKRNQKGRVLASNQPSKTVNKHNALQHQHPSTLSQPQGYFLLRRMGSVLR